MVFVLAAGHRRRSPGGRKTQRRFAVELYGRVQDIAHVDLVVKRFGNGREAASGVDRRRRAPTERPLIGGRRCQIGCRGAMSSHTRRKPVCCGSSGDRFAEFVNRSIDRLTAISIFAAKLVTRWICQFDAAQLQFCRVANSPVQLPAASNQEQCSTSPCHP